MLMSDNCIFILVQDTLRQDCDNVVTNSPNNMLCSPDGCGYTLCSSSDDKYSLWLAAVYETLPQSI